MKLTEGVRELLEGGSALIIGLTRSDGAPYATRGWGLDVDESEAGARVLIRAVDLAPLGFQAGDAPGVPIAVTAADVRTLSSVQVKGTLRELTPSLEADAERKDRYCDGFIEAIVDIDGIALEVAERWRPSDVLVRCWITFDELFTQTPGPSAGASVVRADS